ncbi:MAG: TetR/AcrR family transcriptional regulator [Actinomycetes bacterium]
MSESLDRRAREKGETRELIRTVAHHLFDERGFDAVTIADIARSADVAVQTVIPPGSPSRPIRPPLPPSSRRCGARRYGSSSTRTVSC